MLENTYQNSRRLNPNLITIKDYDGFEAIEKAWRQGLTPDPFLNVSEWADTYRRLPSSTSDEAGAWRTSRTPYLKEIMNSLSVSSPTQKVVFMKGAQVGGTEAGNNFLGYIIHISPGPCMSVFPTVELAKRNSKQRIDPLIESCPELSERILPARAKDSGNTILSKSYPSGTLVLTGSNSPVGLRSMAVRYLILDEIDGFAFDAGGEGCPLLLAERRTATFRRRRKILYISTPTEKSNSRILREFQGNSDQRYYYVPCPVCNKKQPLKFDRLRWEEGKPDTVKYSCVHCESLIEEHNKTFMLKNGEWVATAQGDSNTRGYHLSSLYSPVGWFSWADAAQMYEKALAEPDLMKGFINTVLGEAYEDEFEAPEWERLYERRDNYKMGIVPKDGLFLTAGVDIQKDRIECEVVAWGRNKISWSIDYIVLDGDTAQKKVWDRLERVLNKDWPHELGGTLPIRVMCVDSGYATQDVYSWVKKFPQPVWGAGGARASQPRTVAAIKGRDTETSLIMPPSKAVSEGKRKGLRVYGISTPIAKLELYRWLKLPRLTDDQKKKGEGIPAGSCFFPQYGEEYFKQLTAERLVTKFVKGFPKTHWEKDPTRNNEALDTRIYNRASGSIYGLDRFTELQWRRMEKAIGENGKLIKKKNKKSSSIDLLKTKSSEPTDPYL